MRNTLIISEDVRLALKEKRPVVALESTIISHGMPYPENVKTALEVESILKKEGVTPATIAIIEGNLRVGLSASEIDYLGRLGTKAIKTSRRDIPYLVSQKLDGATTVAATMFIASLAGIAIFATGGIGGVHRDAQQTFDISADLDELAQTPVAVICAGAKSILDLGLTLEYLETKGVPVIGYQTSTLPAFYTRESEFPVPIRLDNPQDIASLLNAKWSVGLLGGVVIANPIPLAYSIPKKSIDLVIDRALLEMKQKTITGKDTTPFLLAKIKEITEGKSLESNIQLVYNNVRLAAQIAREYALILKEDSNAL